MTTPSTPKPLTTSTECPRCGRDGTTPECHCSHAKVLGNIATRLKALERANNTTQAVVGGHDAAIAALQAAVKPNVITADHPAVKPAKATITKVGRAWPNKDGTWNASGWGFEGKLGEDAANDKAETYYGHAWTDLAIMCIRENPREGDRFINTAVNENRKVARISGVLRIVNDEGELMDSGETFDQYFRTSSVGNPSPIPTLAEAQPRVPWASYMEIHPMASRQIWVRWCGVDGIYRWLHPTERRWVEEPEQIGMPTFPDYATARKAADESPEPPTWNEYALSLAAHPKPGQQQAETGAEKHEFIPCPRCNKPMRLHFDAYEPTVYVCDGHVCISSPTPAPVPNESARGTAATKYDWTREPGAKQFFCGICKRYFYSVRECAVCRNCNRETIPVPTESASGVGTVLTEEEKQQIKQGAWPNPLKFQNQLLVIIDRLALKLEKRGAATQVFVDMANERDTLKQQLADMTKARDEAETRCGGHIKIMRKSREMREDYANEVAGLKQQLAQRERELSVTTMERNTWKANHDEMVARNKLLRDRPDLPTDMYAERVKWHETIKQLQDEVTRLRSGTWTGRVVTAAKGVADWDTSDDWNLNLDSWKALVNALASPPDAAEEKEIVYLASPYSHPDPAIHEQRFRVICRVSARLMAAGEIIFSPIAHTHPIALAGKLPTGWDFWKKYDHAMLEASKKIVVVRMDGWDKSKGVIGEIEEMIRQGKPVEYIDPTPDDLVDPAEPRAMGVEMKRLQEMMSQYKSYKPTTTDGLFGQINKVLAEAGIAEGEKL